MHFWKTAVRPLWRRPFFGIAVTGLLALGIAANTALFSVVNAVVLRPLPYPDAAQLVMLLEASPAKSQKESLIAPVLLEDWNRLSGTFTGSRNQLRALGAALRPRPAHHHTQARGGRRRLQHRRRHAA
jgi:hypothetical protein